MSTLLLILLLLLLIGSLPSWGHSRRWGYGPSGVLGFLLLLFAVAVVARLI